MQNSKEIGNEPVVAGNVSEFKLYRAYSIEKNFQNLGPFKIHWFCEGRNEPIGPYDQLIKDYKKGNVNQELGANECFTEIEIKMLRNYLKQDKNCICHNLRSIRRTLPIPGNIIPHSRWCEGLMKMNAQGEIFIENLNPMGGHLCLYSGDFDLPFKVVGYCHPI